MRKYVAEFIGTFFLIFTIVGAVTGGSPMAALGIGAVLMAMVFAGGHISGAHYNPAVSLAAFVRGRLSAAELGGYVAVQLLASAVAGLLAMWVFETSAGAAWEGKAIWVALVVELLFTFALAYVMLNVATSASHPDNDFYGLAIGFIVAAGVVAVGDISGAAFNPAVALGISVGGLSAWANIWVYLVAQAIGGVGAAFAFKWLNPEDV